MRAARALSPTLLEAGGPSDGEAGLPSSATGRGFMPGRRGSSSDRDADEPTDWTGPQARRLLPGSARLLESLPA